jgi:hypothetical protein
MITRAAIEERLKELQRQMEDVQRQRDQAWANLNGLNGAILDCQYWLSVVEQDESTGTAEGGEG